jgi:hypothetical protein
MSFESYEVGIPFVNRPDLLRDAVNSVEPIWGNTVIIDNSDEGLDPLAWPVEVLKPPVPLSASQSFNWLRKRAIDAGNYAWGFLHNDAVAGEGTAEKFVAFIENLQKENRKWGIAYSYYDTFAFFSTAMEIAKGPWDTTLPQYFVDNDARRRSELAGFETVESHLPVAHVGSQTINSDDEWKLKNSITFPLYEFYYQKRWGGSPGKETFKTPFNR